MHPSATFEAAAFCRSEDRVSDFLVAGLVMKPNTPFFTAFKTIAVKTGIIELYLDLSFVSDFIQVINSIIPNAKIKSEELEYTETTKKQLEYTMSCDQLIINPCVLDVSIERETSRKKEYPPISSLLTFIPSASQSRITLDGIELTGFESTQAYIMQNLINPLISEAKQKAAKLFLNVDILLNIGGITDNIIRGQKDPNMTALDVTADTALRIGENIFVAASRIVHGVTADSPITGTSHNRVGLNMTAKETAINGMKSLGVSLLDAPAGIFMDPIRGAQKEGFFGFVKGIGTGITGIITRPVSGIMDATSGLITASRKAVENNTDVHKRLRQSRATVFGVVTPYNHSAAELQLTIRLRDPGSGTLTETVEVVFGQQKAVALTQDAIYFFNEKKEIDNIVLNVHSSE